MDIVVIYPDQKPEAITIDNYEEVKTSLQEFLANYEHILYSPDQLKKAKQDKAALNKFKRAIATRRKEIKDICLEPFYYVDAQLKELQQMIDIPLVKIAEFTSEMDQVQRDTKSATIKLFYDQQATLLGSVADRVFFSSWFYNKKWENRSTPDWRWQKEICQKIEVVAQDIKELSEIAGEYTSAVISRYLETGSKDQAIQFLHFLHSITSIKEDREPNYPTQKSPVPDQPVDNTVQGEEPFQQITEMFIKITGTTKQQSAVLQHLKELGVKYEVFVVGK